MTNTLILLHFVQIKTVMLVAIITIATHYIVSFLCLIRLFNNKPQKLSKTAWNFIILFGIIIGPLVYLILERKEIKIDDKTALNNQSGSEDNDSNSEDNVRGSENNVPDINAEPEEK